MKKPRGQSVSSARGTKKARSAAQEPKARKPAKPGKAAAPAKAAPVAKKKEAAGKKKAGSKQASAPSRPAPAKGSRGRNARADSTNGGAASGPVRKIQIVQQSSLKPGSRGTKALAFERHGGVPGRTVQPPQRRRRFQPFSEEQLERFRQQLIERRNTVAMDLHLMANEALKASAIETSTDSMADSGTDNYEQDFTLGLIESEEALMREIDEALERIEQKTYGACDRCGSAIPTSRLEVLPFTRYCVACQQEREKPGG